MPITHPYRISFKGDNPWDMQVYTTDAEGNKTPLHVKEATITIKPNETVAHVVIHRPSLDLTDIPSSIEVVTPEDLLRQRNAVQQAAKEAFYSWLSSMKENDDRYHTFAMSKLEQNPPRIFLLHRKHDRSDVSGTGFIVAGLDYHEDSSHNRPVHLYWMGPFATKGEYHDIGEVMVIHNHDGETRLVWLEEEEGDHGTHEQAKS